MSEQERRKLEQRILSILRYINHPIVPNLEKNLSLFSIHELLQIEEYLETGSLNPIYQFFEDKKNEYLEIINTLKIQKRYQNLSTIKLKEKLEIETEKEELNMITFDF